MPANFNRRTFLKLTAAVMAASSLAASTGCSSSAASSANSSASASASASPAAANAQPLATFMLLSDTHVDPGNSQSEERFTEVLRQIATFDTRPDSIFIVGDLTDNGTQEQYDLAMDLIDRSPFEKADFTFVCGNHDQCVNEETEEEYAQYRQRFIANTGIPSLYYDTTIAGQHIIVLGCDYPLPGDWMRFHLTPEQLSWLDSLLEADEEAGVVPLVLCHEPIDGTVTGTYEGEWGAGNCFYDQGKELLAVFKKHPRCVYITGHTHIFPGVEASDPTLPVFVNTGSAVRSYYSLNKVSANELVFDGVQMQIYPDRYEFSFRNFKTDSWEGETIAVPLPSSR